MRTVLTFPFLLAVGGCIATGNPAIQGSGDSNVRMLRVGMTEADASEIIGAFQDESFEPGSSANSCRSYEYDETIDRKFAYVFFSNGRIVAASDGHRDVCVYAEDRPDLP